MTEFNNIKTKHTHKFLIYLLYNKEKAKIKSGSVLILICCYLLCKYFLFNAYLRTKTSSYKVLCNSVIEKNAANQVFNLFFRITSRKRIRNLNEYIFFFLKYFIEEERDEEITYIYEPVT